MENISTMINKKPHLTKEERIPQCYRDVSKALKVVKSCKGNLKTVLYNTKLRGAYLQRVQALASNVLKHYRVVAKVIEAVGLLEKEPYLLREYAEIMVCELLFGRGLLAGKCKPIVTVQKYQQNIMKAFQSLDLTKESDTGLCSLPRWVRVNTLVLEVVKVLEELHQLGYEEVNCDVQSQEQYLELVKSLKSPQFLVDYHFKDMLVFASGENLCQLKMYQKGGIVLQDKSSYIPVQVLNPEPGSMVLDACAAPGMKTIHLASVMQNQGELYAFERDEGRFATLKSIINRYKIEICKPFLQDFKSTDPTGYPYSKVRYILLDPSCSGSGMVSRMDEVTDLPDSKSKSRLQKLAGFQIILLKHALKFPSVKRVVYSTCSIHEEENEFVVHEALGAFRDRFRLVPVLPEWPSRGLDTYEFGSLCLRSYPEKNLTNGFFVAAFERVDSSSEERATNGSWKSGKDGNFTESSNGKRKKKKHRSESNADENEHNANNITENDTSNLSNSTECSSSKKKKKKHRSESNTDEDEHNASYATGNEISNLSHEDNASTKSQKRKKQKTERHRSEGMQEQLAPLASYWGSNEPSSNAKDDALPLDPRAMPEDMSQADTPYIHKKGKKKFSQQTESENEPFSDEHSVKPKKKKHKRKHEDNELTTSDMLEGYESTLTHASKIDDSQETNLVECLGLVKKHKKKKQKDHDQNENESVECIVADSKKKHKKKKKHEVE